MICMKTPPRRQPSRSNIEFTTLAAYFQGVVRRCGFRGGAENVPDKGYLCIQAVANEEYERAASLRDDRPPQPATAEVSGGG